jgi:hypothetical protein
MQNAVFVCDPPRNVEYLRPALPFILVSNSVIKATLFALPVV